MGNQYINYILSISNIFGFLPLSVSLKKNRLISIFILFIILISSLHHLTETNEMGHSLEGIKLYGLIQYGYEIRIIDIVIAYSFFVYLIIYFGIKKISIFIIKNRLFFPLPFLCSFICDYLISNKPDLYLFLHLFWHIGIYFIIYLLLLTI